MWYIWGAIVYIIISTTTLWWIPLGISIYNQSVGFLNRSEKVKDNDYLIAICNLFGEYAFDMDTMRPMLGIIVVGTIVWPLAILILIFVAILYFVRYQKEYNLKKEKENVTSIPNNDK